MSFKLPPLWERSGDVSLLIDHFLSPDWEIEPDARQTLESFSWPGNVRQLINALERATIMADDRNITLDDLPYEIVNSTAEPARPLPGGVLKLEEIERAHILEVIQQEHGNKTRTARVLGIHRRKLYRLLERYNIQLDEE
jgi:DNA-binding NtrC family response regulator